MPFLRPGNEENGYTKNTTVVPEPDKKPYTEHCHSTCSDRSGLVGIGWWTWTLYLSTQFTVHLQANKLANKE